MDPPRIDPNALPVGLVAEGRDQSLYCVTHDPLFSTERFWRLFHRVSRVVVGNEVRYELVDTPPFPDIIDDDVDAESPPPTPPSELLELPRRRGRPPKADNKKKRKPRPLTAYNDFIKNEMPNYKHITDSRLRMKMITELWKLQKTIKH